MKSTRGILCASLAYLLGVCSWTGTNAKSAVQPDCGHELCVKGYERCIESRCRNCADFAGTEYGCRNIDTQRECSSFCIDEVERSLNDTIQSLKHQFASRTQCENQGNQLPTGIIVLIAVAAAFVVGISTGAGGIILVRRFRLYHSQSNTSSEESLDPGNGSMDMSNFKDPRLSQVPPRDESQRLIAQETTS